MQQPPQQQTHEEEVVDEAGLETFPASDAPGWNPTHAGAPLHRELTPDHGHEVLRAQLRADVERLRRPIADLEERRRAREEIVSRALLGASRAVVREPVDPALRVRTLESEQLGAMREASCVIFGARYDADDISGIAALLAVSRGLAESLAGTGITVNCVLPGPTKSRGVGDFVEALAKQAGKTFQQFETEFFKSVRPTSLIKRFATPQEVASMVAYVASPLSSATTGAALRVDGGVVKSAF